MVIIVLLIKIGIYGIKKINKLYNCLLVYKK